MKKLLALALALALVCSSALAQVSGSGPSVGGLPSSPGFASVITPIVDSGVAGSLSLRTNNGTVGLLVSDVASGVNAVQVQSSTAGSGPLFIPTGTDTNIDLRYFTKGTGAHTFVTSSAGTNIQFQVLSTAGSTRNITVTGSNGGNPTISTTGGALNIGGVQLTSTKTCATNYIRVGPNFCLWNAAAPNAITIGTTCTALTAPAGAIAILAQMQIQVTATNTLNALDVSTASAYNDNNVCTTAVQSITCTAKEFTATAAGNQIGQCGSLLVAPVNTGNANFKMTSGSAGLSIASVVGYFD